MSEYAIENVLRRETGNIVYFFGSLANDMIKQLTEVLVIEKSPKTFLTETTEEGYQRPAAFSRQRKIGKYLVEHANVLIPPVLLNGCGRWVFEAYDSERPSMGKLRTEGRSHIIDGQHRLGGFVAAWEESQYRADVDFVAYENLPFEREKDEFNLINTTQKGVPKAISAYILRNEDDHNWVAWELNQRDNSPFRGRISRVGKLSENMLFNLNSVAKSVDRTFGHPNFDQLDRETMLEYMIHYWTIIKDSFPDAWADYDRPKDEWQYKLLELTGLIAWSHIAHTTLGRAYDSQMETMNWELVQELIDRTKTLDWGKDGRYVGLTGEVGGKEIMRDMLRLIDRPAA
jgi:DGQHR domain-containing protein